MNFKGFVLHILRPNLESLIKAQNFIQQTPEKKQRIENQPWVITELTKKKKNKTNPVNTAQTE